MWNLRMKNSCTVRTLCWICEKQYSSLLHTLTHIPLACHSCFYSLFTSIFNVAVLFLKNSISERIVCERTGSVYFMLLDKWEIQKDFASEVAVTSTATVEVRIHVGTLNIQHRLSGKDVQRGRVAYCSLPVCLSAVGLPSPPSPAPVYI